MIKKQEDKNKTFRRYVFTCFKMDINFNKLYLDNINQIQYLIAQLEIGEKTGRKHYQGCIHLKTPVRIKWLRKRFDFQPGEGKGGWFAPQRGTNEQVRSYCTKLSTRSHENVTFELGEPNTQGKRHDLLMIKKQLDNDKGLYDISQNHFSAFVRYWRSFNKYKTLLLQKQSKVFRNIDVILILGSTGIGKTRYAYDKHNTDNIYKINCSKGCEWFDGYNGQSILLLDEFKNQLSLTYLLDLLDGYECRLPIKGSFTYALWTKVYITSNLRKEQIYPNVSDELKDPLWRRVTEIIHLSRSDG